MARMIVPLSDIKIKNLTYEGKPKKHFDGGGLYLLVNKTSKLFRIKYTYEGKEKTYSIGTYPKISLADARKAREQLKDDLANGINPGEAKKEKKIHTKIIANEEENSFKKVALEYLAKKDGELNIRYLSNLHRIFENDVYDFIGKQAIHTITPKQIIEILKRVEQRGAVESSHRLYTQINKIYRFASSNMYVETNPCQAIDKTELLKKKVHIHYPTITNPTDIKNLLQAIDEYTGDYTTRMALTLLPYLFLRPFNIRHLEWKEIDFKKKQITIPGAKMKTKNDHISPLTPRTIEILKEVHQYSNNSKFVFPSMRSKDKTLSDNALLNALRNMGITKEQLVPHGFRAMFSTIAHEAGKKHEVIETQLAHSVGNQVSQAYNRAIYLEERTELMQWWSDWLDEVKNV